MDRRWWGGIMVACVLLAAVVVPNILAHRVAGRPVTVVVADRPAVGSCVVTMDDPWRYFAALAPGADDVIDFPTAGYGSCDGPIVGEVISVGASDVPAQRISGTRYQSEAAGCGLDAIGYTGSIAPVVSESSVRQGLIWRPGLSFQYTLVGPDPVQRAIGQLWTACVISSIDDGSYQGSLRNALTTGALPTGFGSCWSSIELGGPDEIPCDRPHRIELLGTTDLADPVPTAVVQDACVVFAGRVLRSADPTHDGQLRLQLLRLDETPLIMTPSPDLVQGRFIACIATAVDGANFTGSIIGLGERPLPIG